ncbi:MAG: class I SAM-dependent methyltransferase [Burkholderiales bacterium]|nr:class I SAM-dependent methyltransferase [Anaerolineae bacterium]
MPNAPKPPSKPPNPVMRPQANICDYEGSNYRTEFWENTGRAYEDQVERIALRRLLPTQGRRLLEVGAGFGRLTNEYHGYDQVVLLDYSLSQLQYAQEHLGRSPRFVYVAVDAYHLPFRAGVFDGASMIRVIHHMADPRAVLSEIRRVMTPGGTFILEHANKRNLKAILRHALGKQDWNPHDLAPVEFVELNFDFHPEYIRDELQAAGFAPRQRVPVSFFRVPTLKEKIRTDWLVNADSVLQRTGLLVTPSVFVKNVATGDTPNNMALANDNEDIEALFANPSNGGPLVREGDVLVSSETGERYAIRDGIYDFKAPLED